MAISTAGPRRFAVVGEPIVAVDLIDTVAPPGSAAGDLLAADGDAETWWRIQAARVPGGEVPDLRALRRLRSALREMMEALVDGRQVPQAAVSELNFFMQSAPASTRLLLTGTRLRAQTQWHREYGGNPRLAFIATQAAQFLSDPPKVSLLAPVREPGLFDDLHCGQPAAVMVRARRVRQPGPRRPALPPRRAWLTPAQAGWRGTRGSREDRAASGHRQNAAAGHRAARRR